MTDFLVTHIDGTHQPEETGEAPKNGPSRGYAEKTMSKRARVTEHGVSLQGHEPVRQTTAPARPAADLTVMCVLCGQKVPPWELRKHKREVHGEKKSKAGSGLAPRRLLRRWVRLVSGGLPGLGKHSR